MSGGDDKVHLKSSLCVKKIPTLKAKNNSFIIVHIAVE
jgi:hypothetical protein